MTPSRGHIAPDTDRGNKMLEESQGATPEVEAQPVEPVSMDDTIRETLRSLTSDEPTPESSDTTPESPEEKATRIRDNQGKFAKAPDAEQTPETTEEAAPEAEAWNPPNTWKKEAAEKLRAADPAIRAEVERREADFHKGIEQYRNAAHFAQTIERAITPFMGTINQLGITPDVAIHELMKTDQALRYGSQQEKVALLNQLAQSYGIDMQTAASYEAPYVDPQVSALQQQVQQMQGYFQQQNQMAQQQEMQALNSEIANFASDPKHSHFESVKGHMAALLQAGQAKDLSDAYEQAIYANPTTRAAVLAEQQAAARAAAAQKAQAAKQSASVNHKSRPAMPTQQPIGTMDDTIRNTLRQLQGGV